MYILEVLHGVLYPETHINGIKKKKDLPKVHLTHLILYNLTLRLFAYISRGTEKERQ